MNRNRNTPTRRRGFAMLLVMGAVSIVFVIGMVLLAGAPADSRASRNLVDRERAIYLAESGLTEALYRLQNPPSTGETWSGVTGRSIGSSDGTYDVSVTDMGDSLYRIRATGRVPAQNGSEAAQQIQMLVQMTSQRQMNFDIVDNEIVVHEPYAVKTTVLGANARSGGSPMPITMEVRIGDNSIDPHGSFSDPVAGSVNKDGDFVYIDPDLHASDQKVSVWAQSWEKIRSWYSGTQASHYRSVILANTSEGSGKVIALKNGDPVPDISSLRGQGNNMVSDYIDWDTGTMKLGVNQVIYIFEMTTTNPNSGASDYTDLGVMVTLADSVEALQNDSGGLSGGSSGGSGVTLLGYIRTDDEQKIDAFIGRITGGTADAVTNESTGGTQNLVP